MKSLPLVHIISLQAVGGIEKDYTQLINAKSNNFKTEHHTVITKNFIDPNLINHVKSGSASIRRLKYFAGLRLPDYPLSLRRLRFKGIIKKSKAKAAIFWSNPGTLKFIDNLNDSKVVYYEHGAAWFKEYNQQISESLNKTDCIICVSYAAKRMLELKWNVHPQRIKVCLNAIRPDCHPIKNQSKSIKQKKSMRIGIAGRLEPIKGTSLAIHALYYLKDNYKPLELVIAGKGTELNRLKELVNSLNLNEQVIFKEHVENMHDFYESIDLLLNLSLRESFGLACAEAQAHGCPVIGSRVDGIPEVVKNMETGLTISPSLPASRYAELSTSLENLPQMVYYPEHDCIAAPQFLSPEDIAKSITYLFDRPNLYAKMSKNAILVANKRFCYQDHVEELLSLISHNC